MNSLTETLLALREWRDARAACSHTWCNLSAPDQELTAAQDRLVAAEAKLVALTDALPAVSNSDQIVFWPPEWAPPMFAPHGDGYRLVGPAEALVKHVALDELQFRALVAGRVVETAGVCLILSDIGWDRMLVAIEDAGDDRPQGPAEALER